MLYADTGGTIGWQLIGEVPTRRGGYGLLPRPADLPDSGWNGTVPFEAMPFAVNPECGYLATANDDPSNWADDLTRPLPLGEEESVGSTRGRDDARLSTPLPREGRRWPGSVSDFIDDYRARRIRERLSQRDSELDARRGRRFKWMCSRFRGEKCATWCCRSAPTDPAARDATRPARAVGRPRGERIARRGGVRTVRR